MTIHPLHKTPGTLADNVIVSKRQLASPDDDSGGSRTGDMDTHVMTSKGENSWTNEKHVKYLNSMEQSFVRAMFENNINNGGGRVLRLDRYLPDTSESTLDLKPHRSKKYYISDSTCKRGRRDRRAEKRSRRVMLSQPLTSSSSQDQVVPQFENRRGGDKDEGDHPEMAPAN
ncbi:hypothetical protein FNV43_RR24113 [Rhamnella rubrinervis]|uniref:Uncharacterized protein n=1 Tax=Rhamnella rubrinervis TaxID=2594499 RepID=A0A8K0DM70_9ROSA|nr:hypothetical protein FNV43_RR24113 [Rhamnella rubrinervis]